jgi:23S rRNA (adenine2503-C2)-methyltransferase
VRTAQYGGGVPSPFDLTRAELSALLGDQPRFRVEQVWDGLYRQGRPLEELTTLPLGLRSRLAAKLPPALSPVTAQTADDGETVKWLWTLQDGTQVETVLMHYPGRTTVCVSSQAGCAMGCGFCATGQAGYERNLTRGEILEQVIRARREAEASGRRLSNVVFMGMGEPLANYDRVLGAVRALNTDLGLGARHLTISTVGLVPQILRLAEEGLQVGLAISLHAANDTLRDELVPINRRHRLADLVAAAQLYRERTGRRVSFEWAMIDGVNDRPQDAAELALLCARARAHVNLIPLNPTPGWPTTGSPPARVRQFARRLTEAGVNVTVRANRGTDIDAACGQLRANQSVTTPVALPTRR